MRPLTVRIATVLVAGLLVVPTLLVPVPAAAQVEDAGEILAVAHRGGSAYAPENTLLAIDNAARLGVDAIEFDVMFSADGELVVFHDDTLERTTDCEGTVSDWTVAELTDCDAAHWFSPGQPVTQPDEDLDHPLRGAGVGIPTLDEIFAWAAAYGDDLPTLFVEVKTIPGEANFDPIAVDYAEEVLRLADEHGVTGQIVVLSFWPAVIDWVKQLNPDVPTKLLTTSEVAITATMNLTYVVTRDHDIAGPNFTAPDFTNQFVAAAHGAGKQVSTWTVNEVGDIETVLEIGPDAITSDVPACLMAIQDRSVPAQIVPDLVIERGGDDIAPCLDGSDPRPPPGEEEEAAPTDDGGQTVAAPLPATGADAGATSLGLLFLGLALGGLLARKHI
jgi:glycerophosphoryl diester phosphodiesterase